MMRWMMEMLGDMTSEKHSHGFEVLFGERFMDIRLGHLGFGSSLMMGIRKQLGHTRYLTIDMTRQWKQT